ncbi:CDGSH iron-sulfur domain-containing protein [Malaciobacter marinus]|jgi:CDGSH-type Zn-finger protein|uniref:CDGSH iron-sulfur domain-containing protein n=1 Tax=Malaciobacter TaxID=2321114 RepID=UPI0009A7BD89|nr:CDGSH iron-sulfur domain-containing protein [Malaciobacter marinus]SKB77386.1 Iron-binding zinc finger CDGSH type [Malaciobacter marinus]
MKKLSLKFFKNGPIKLINDSDFLLENSIIYEDKSFDLNKSTFICRCGRSKKQPFCEGSHSNSRFDTRCKISKEKFSQTFKNSSLTSTSNELHNCAQLIIKENSPILAKGNISLKINNIPEVIDKRNFNLCRCGSSKYMPFCDSSHNDFERRYYTF